MVDKRLLHQGKPRLDYARFCHGPDRVESLGVDSVMFLDRRKGLDSQRADCVIYAEHMKAVHNYTGFTMYLNDGSVKQYIL